MSTTYEQLSEIKSILWDMQAQLNWLVNRMMALENEISKQKTQQRKANFK